MSKKTEEFEKLGVIENVKQHLVKLSNHKKQLEKLETENDLNKAYVIALRYGRNYIHYDDKEKRNEFFKESYWLGRKLIRINEKEIMKEDIEELCSAPLEENGVLTNDEFIREIEVIDEEIENRTSEGLGKEHGGTSEIFKMALESGITQFYDSYINTINVKSMAIGVKNGNPVYYVSDFNKFIEIIKG